MCIVRDRSVIVCWYRLTYFASNINQVGNPDTWAVLILRQSFQVSNSHYKEIFILRSPPCILSCNCLGRKIRQCLIYSLSVGNYNTSPSHICSYHGNNRVGRISNALRSPKVLSNAVTFVIYHRFLWHIYMPQRTFRSFFKISAEFHLGKQYLVCNLYKRSNHAFWKVTIMVVIEWRDNATFISAWQHYTQPWMDLEMSSLQCMKNHK